MLARTAVLLVLLHLHASDTLREDLPKHKSAIQIPEEDLLDLMVRIAESPAEWERVHRVLSLLGDEKHQSNDEKLPGATKIQHNLENDSSNKTSQIINPTKPNTTKGILDHLEYQIDQTTKKSIETDTGWPDFNEAIFKQVKKPTSYEENDVMESEWLEKEWFDTYLSDYLNAQKDHETLLQEKAVNNPAVSFIPARENKPNQDITPNTPDNTVPNIFKDSPSLSNDPLIFDNRSNVSNISLEESKGEKPVFLYHRVTLGPQEKKGSNAFIAVSVVKQSNIDSSATTLVPPSSQDLYRIQESPKQRKEQTNNHQHLKGQRRHHSHTRTHTHSHH